MASIWARYINWYARFGYFALYSVSLTFSANHPPMTVNLPSVIPHSSFASRRTQSSGLSPASTWPPGSPQPLSGLEMAICPFGVIATTKQEVTVPGGTSVNGVNRTLVDESLPQINFWKRIFAHCSHDYIMTQSVLSGPGLVQALFQRLCASFD